MTDSISFTIPLDYNALTRTSDMLHGMALDIKNDKPVDSLVADITQPKKADTSALTPPPPAAESVKKVVNINLDDVPAPTPPTPPQEIEVPEDTGGEEITVELDSAGLPHDARIHSAKKTKLAKTKAWKKKRNVDTALVEAVETELRAAMDANPVTSSTPTPAAPPPPPATVPDTPALNQTITGYLVDGKHFTVDQLVAAGWTDEGIATLEAVYFTPANTTEAVDITFPELMSKVTGAIAAGTLVQATVDKVLNDNGLAQMPLLISRPDLIPTVNAALFPNG